MFELQRLQDHMEMSLLCKSARTTDAENCVDTDIAIRTSVKEKLHSLRFNHEIR